MLISPSKFPKTTAGVGTCTERYERVDRHLREFALLLKYGMGEACSCAIRSTNHSNRFDHRHGPIRTYSWLAGSRVLYQHYCDM